MGKKLNITTFIFIIVNLLFVAKYLARIVGLWCIVAVLVILALYVMFFKYAMPFIVERKKWHKPIFLFLLCLVCSEIFLQYYINPFSVKVDRWSALYYPIQNLLNGSYPYGAQTHLGGYASPFPIWLLIHIPFYLCGNVGLSFFVFLAFFLLSVYKIQGKQYLLPCFILISISPAILYEIMVRSDLIGNMLLLAGLINIVVNKINTCWLEKNYLIIAFVSGLLMSTRLVCIIPIGMLILPYFFKMDVKKQLLFVVVTAFVFILTFLPFVMMDWNLFWNFEYSPWMLQTRQGHVIDFILFVPLFCYMGLTWKNSEMEYYRNVATMLFAFICITFLHTMCVTGSFNLFSAAYDITYFTMSFPFCILSIVLKYVHNAYRDTCL
ncbi:MAG: hypothetical protein MJ003_02140 [Paludibacteraceae bacterium]|nr:hypothetical protein [Paludibacteraceae bacterium]